MGSNIKIKSLIGSGAWYFALTGLWSHINNKGMILQAELAKAPELTEKVYQTAIYIAEKSSSGDLYLGMFSVGVASCLTASVINDFYKLRKEN